MTHQKIFTEALFVKAKTGKIQCPVTGKLIYKLWYIQKSDYYTVVEMKQVYFLHLKIYKCYNLEKTMWNKKDIQYKL